MYIDLSLKYNVVIANGLDFASATIKIRERKTASDPKKNQEEVLFDPFWFIVK